MVFAVDTVTFSANPNSSSRSATITATASANSKSGSKGVTLTQEAKESGPTRVKIYYPQNVYVSGCRGVAIAGDLSNYYNKAQRRWEGEWSWADVNSECKFNIVAMELDNDAGATHCSFDMERATGDLESGSSTHMPTYEKQGYPGNYAFVSEDLKIKTGTEDVYMADLTVVVS